MGLLEKTLEECRWLYNHFLEERKVAWEERKESISYYQQSSSIPELKKERISLMEVNAQVLQNVAVRVDLAFKAFFRRVKAGRKPGYPRFRGRGRYNSFTFPQVISRCYIQGNKLFVSKIGHIKTKLHRPIKGTPKTATVHKSHTGKWYISFSCEVEEKHLPSLKLEVGIDVGLESFATFSTGEKIENPRFFHRDEKDLGRLQRKLSKVEKGTPRGDKVRKAVARCHERIMFRRKDFSHQHSHRIVNRFDFICLENLSVNQMAHNHCLAKSIHDAAWSQFSQHLAYKAEYAGRKLVWVNPAYTSQDCSRCWHRETKKLSERLHQCKCCGLEMDRDYNAALNILSLGRQALVLA